MLTRSAKKKVFDRLSDEIVEKILSYVPHDDYLNIRLVNRRFNRISQTGYFWKKVELNFPRTMDQMYQLTTKVFPSVGANLEHLKITGFHTVPITGEPRNPRLIDEDSYRSARYRPAEPVTLNTQLLGIIQAHCPRLKTLIIRNCWVFFEHDSHEFIPDSLERLEFHGCRLPELPSNWMGQMASGRVTHTLNNLTTVKFERCFHVDMEFLRYLRACPAIRNFSMKGSLLMFVYPDYRVPADPTYPIDIWEHLRVLDISGTGRFPVLINDRVLNDPRCAITHLFMENCALLSRRVHVDHLKIEYLSVAGYRPPAGVGNAFDDIDAWASLPTVKQINASGCDLTQAQREELVARHQGVVFNIGVEFEESPRVGF